MVLFIHQLYIMFFYVGRRELLGTLFALIYIAPNDCGVERWQNG